MERRATRTNSFGPGDIPEKPVRVERDHVGPGPIDRRATGPEGQLGGPMLYGLADQVTAVPLEKIPTITQDLRDHPAIEQKPLQPTDTDNLVQHRQTGVLNTGNSQIAGLDKQSGRAQTMMPLQGGQYYRSPFDMQTSMQQHQNQFYQPAFTGRRVEKRVTHHLGDLIKSGGPRALPVMPDVFRQPSELPGQQSDYWGRPAFRHAVSMEVPALTRVLSHPHEEEHDRIISQIATQEPQLLPIQSEEARIKKENTRYYENEFHAKPHHVPGPGEMIPNISTNVGQSINLRGTGACFNPNDLNGQNPDQAAEFEATHLRTREELAPAYQTSNLAMPVKLPTSIREERKEVEFMDNTPGHHPDRH